MNRWMFPAALALLAVATLAIVLTAGLAIRDGFREERRLRALPPAEQAIERHEMGDGTICYQPRYGWNRPLSCIRP